MYLCFVALPTNTTADDEHLYFNRAAAQADIEPLLDERLCRDYRCAGVMVASAVIRHTRRRASCVCALGMQIRGKGLSR